MSTDALAPDVARSTTTMVFSMQDNLVLVFYGVEFQPPVPSQFTEIIENANIDGDDGLVQEGHNSSALAMELCLSCSNPSIYSYVS